MPARKKSAASKKSTAPAGARKKTTRKPAGKKKTTRKATRKATKVGATGKKKRKRNPFPKTKPRPGMEKIATEKPEKRLGGSRPGAGHPSFQPTEEQRANVRAVAALMKLEDICPLVRWPNGDPITVETLRKHFKRELEDGKSRTDARIGQSLVQRAVDLQHPQGATCAIFYAKTRMGWRETVNVDATVRSGVLVAPSSATPDDWIADANERAAEQVEPGTEEED